MTSHYLLLHRVAIRNVFTLFISHPLATDIYSLSLHDALPISLAVRQSDTDLLATLNSGLAKLKDSGKLDEIVEKWRSEEHTSELQSRGHLVCRLLREKKKLGWKLKSYPRVNRNYIVHALIHVV